jgi:Heparinase II/III-like protein/Heparinase II/III N-terminus
MSAGWAMFGRRASRAWHTARHVPPGQLLRRAELLARYRLMDLVPRRSRAPLPPPAGAERLPSPPFDARSDLLRTAPDGLVLRLPWGERALTWPVAWGPGGTGGDGTARADVNNAHFMEYLESADDAVFARLVDDWIAGNPRHARDAWRHAWRPYNLSLRVVVWMEELARRAGRLEPGFVARMLASSAEQLRFLEGHLETDLRGNHLIKNIRALLWGGACFSGPEAARWTALGTRLLRRELAEQVLPDGCHYERSPAYHCQVMGDLLACRAALPEPLPELEDALARMASALVRLTHPDGDVALFNDGGLSMALPPARLLEAFARSVGQPPVPGPGPFAQRDAGYFGLQAEGELLVIDCGALGPDYLPGHGHCDLLSFEWSTGGRRIVVDQGTHQYMAGQRRLASRRTRSHNTLVIGDAEQSDIYCAFRCGRRASPELRAFTPRGGGFSFVGSHDGFAGLAGRPRHVRAVEARPGSIEILDHVEAKGRHAAAAHLLLHPGCAVDVRGGGEATIRNGPVKVNLAASVEVSAEPAEWYPDIHVAEPTTRLVFGIPDRKHSLELRLWREASG